MPSSSHRLITAKVPDRLLLIVLSVLLIFIVSACGSTPQGALVGSDSRASETAGEGAESETSFEGIDPLSADQALPPIMLSIPDIQLEATVEPMGWSVEEIDGERMTKWIVPESAIGWHVNSARAGASGNLILSGHQVRGDALLAPLSLGDVIVGQEVLVEDEEGVVFVYQVIDISEPIPALGASEDEMDQAMNYLNQTDEGVLTLITGWPDFTTTHRIFAQAELLGVE